MSGDVAAGMGAAAVLLVVGLALMWAGRMFSRGSIGRNGFVGIRTRWTLSSDARWEAGHRAGAKWTVIGGAGTVVGALLALISGLMSPMGVSDGAVNATIAGFIIASCIWVLGASIASAVAANRAAKALPD